MYSRIVGTRRTRSAAKRANCVRAVAVSGVARLPTGITVQTMRMSRNTPAAATDCSACSWSAGTALQPGDQFAVTRIVSYPAAFASSSFDIATWGSAFRPSSSAAPMYIEALARAAAGAARAARAQRSAMRGRS